MEDGRSAFGRFFDRLTGRKYIGEYKFSSPIEERRPRTIRATLVDGKEGSSLTLIDNRKGYQGIYKHVC